MLQRMSLADRYTGHEAIIQRSNVTLTHPVERGVVTHWTEMELVWEHAYESLGVNPDQQPLLVTESVLNPPPSRLRTVETFLETYQVPGIIVTNTASLCLYADTGGSECTGLVLESGYSATYAVPVVKGEVIHSAVTRLDLGGNDLTVFLLRLVESRGNFFPPAKRGMFSEVKEKLCYVAMDFAQEDHLANMSSTSSQSYNLAGDVVTLQTERFQCPESLFQPNWLRVDAVGVHQLIHNAIEKCPADVHEALYENVLVSGGCTCFAGFHERLEAELGKLCPGGSRGVSVRSPDNPKTLAWRGGSEFARSSEAREKWITLKEYREEGDAILERKRCVFASKDTGETAGIHGDKDHRHSDSHTQNTSPRNLKDSSRNSSRSVGSNTPGTMYKEKKITYPSATTTPGLYGHSSTPASGMRSHPSSPGLRGGKVSRVSLQSVTPSAADPVGHRGSSHPNYVFSPGFHVRKIADEARPTSPSPYDQPHFHPTLPKTPEISDSEETDELPPLEASSKDTNPPKNSAGKERKNSENANSRKMSYTDFASLRKMSLFDHLMDEVATFGPPEEEEEEKSKEKEITVIPEAPEPRDRTLFDKLKEEELLPGRGRSGLRRNETIDLAEMKKTTGPTGDGPVKSEPELLGTVPVIEITTCPTPRGSVSSGESEGVAPVQAPQRTVRFKFSE